MGALGLFTFLPQDTVHNLRISELGVPVYSVPWLRLRPKRDWIRVCAKKEKIFAKFLHFFRISFARERCENFRFNLFCKKMSNLREIRNDKFREKMRIFREKIRNKKCKILPKIRHTCGFPKKKFREHFLVKFRFFHIFRFIHFRETFRSLRKLDWILIEETKIGSFVWILLIKNG